MTIFKPLILALILVSTLQTPLSALEHDVPLSETSASDPEILDIPLFDQTPWQCPAFAPGVLVGNIGYAEIVEASGLAASRKNPEITWTHNDGPNGQYIYAMTQNGIFLGRYQYQASYVNVEDIAIGPGPETGVDYIYVADIGDNNNNRPNIKVFRLPEPEVSAGQIPVFEDLRSTAVSFTFQYPDGAHDAESIMVDTNGDIYIITKRNSEYLHVYRAPYPQSTSNVAILQRVAELPWLMDNNADGRQGVTAGDISKDGRLVIARRYTHQTPSAAIWYRRPNSNVWGAFRDQNRCDLTLLPEVQGEAVSFDANGMGFYTTSEGAAAPIYYYARIPVCGNGLLETAESCDDGNVQPNDGCSINCLIESPAPIVNAGSDQKITLPKATITLRGTAVDPTQLLLTYEWTQIGGPDGIRFTNPNTQDTAVSGFINGTYVFRLTAKNDTTFASDDVVVTAAPSEKRSLSSR